MDCNVLEILPVVFYDLARVHEVITPNPREGFRRADLSVLTADDLRRLTQGRGALRGRFIDRITNLLALILHDDCKRITVPGKLSPCHAGLKRWWDAQLGSGPSAADPICWLQKQVSLCDDIPHDEVCGGCTRVVKKYIQAVREDLWTSLPDFFGLVSISRRAPPFNIDCFDTNRRDCSPLTGAESRSQNCGSETKARIRGSGEDLY
jgi:hypothetical protein